MFTMFMSDVFTVFNECFGAQRCPFEIGNYLLFKLLTTQLALQVVCDSSKSCRGSPVPIDVICNTPVPCGIFYHDMQIS